MIHIRFEGRSYDVATAQLEVMPGDGVVKERKNIFYERTSTE